MPVSSSDEDIEGIPSMQSFHAAFSAMQSSYSAEMKRSEICMEERSVHCECLGCNPRRHCVGY